MTHGINFLQVKNSLPIANASTAKIVSVLIPIESFCDHSINKIREIKFRVYVLKTTTSQNRFVFGSQWDADCACVMYIS